MASRVRNAWALLAGQVAAFQEEGPQVVAVLQHWLRSDLQHVSKKAAARMTAAKGIALLLETSTSALPVSAAAAREFREALRSGQPAVDPEAFVDFVNDLCWKLAVYRREDDSCPMDYDGDLELWTDGHRLFEVCDSLGHTFDENGQLLSGVPVNLQPANLDDVLRRYEAPSLAYGRHATLHVSPNRDETD